MNARALIRRQRDIVGARPRIFILRSAQEGADAERAAILELLERWITEAARNNCEAREYLKLRFAAQAIRQGCHRAPFPAPSERRSAA